ncbi:MAG TPA: phosphatase PAP2 family protein [Thermoanaerobaculia bacterium]|nr:phosphatase PAP2 family protein [Thermoanaerobaculia bacterium]
MIANRRLHARPYFFELFTIANLIAIVLLARDTRSFLGTAGDVLGFAVSIALYGGLGVAVRAIVAKMRGDRAYLRIIRSKAWLADSARILFFGGLLVYTYAWIKLLVPVLHPRLFDQQLWDLDRLLCFGLSPNVLFLDLFSSRPALLFVDFTYAAVFFASMALAFGYFVSSAHRRARIAFANGNAAIWIVGAWLYMLVPSLGPAFAFPDLWLPHQHDLHTASLLQAKLIRNYQNVLRAAAGAPANGISLIFGIGAFPSLHVGFQAYVFFWMRRFWTSGEVIFALFTATIFLGSMVTGWHYMIDGIAGAALAFACYTFSWKTAKMSQFRRISARFGSHATNATTVVSR